MNAYPTLADGSRALLVDAVNCVLGTGHAFVVVGGWSPVLLNSDVIHHPGTIDVDLLFEEGATMGALGEVIEALKREGFHHSAKHHFQLLRTVLINDEEFVFNIDLLHPSEALSDRPSVADMFVDHIELEIPTGAMNGERFRAKSIAAPYSGFIFKDQRYVSVAVSIADLEGAMRTATVPVIDELALLVTKSRSVKLPKRPRDAFDIYLAVRHARDPDHLLSVTRELEHRTTEAYLSLSSIRDVLGDGSFDRRVNDYLSAEVRLKDSEVLLKRPYSTVLLEFLDNAGVP